MTIAPLADTDLSGVSKIWASLITNEKYVPGLLTLDYTLKRSGSKYPLVALYTDQLEGSSIEAMQRRGIALRRIDELTPAESPELSADPRFKDCWSKLYIFKLVEFERVVELDSDMVILRNMDELMDVPLGDNVFACAPACVCNPFRLSHYPNEWIPENCSFTDYHGKKRRTLDVCDQFFKVKGPCSDLGLGKCNSGLIIVEPHIDHYKQVLNTLKDPAKTSRYQFPDQELLADIFPWLSLSYVYNCLKSFKACHPEIWNMDAIKNIHYILTPKPWQVAEGSYDDPTGTFVHWWAADRERREVEKRRGIVDDV